MEIEKSTLWSLNWLRHCSRVVEQKLVKTADSSNPSKKEKLVHNDIGGLIRSLNAFEFQTYLQELGNERPRITYKELLRHAEDWKVCTTKKENRQICDELIASGTLFRYKDEVYLTVEDLADLIKSRLPDSLIETRTKVNQLEQEFEVLETEKRKVDTNAEKWNTRVLYSGLTLLAAQFIVSLLLVEQLSWDLLEPCFYFLTLSNQFLLYLFWIWKHQQCDLSSICSFVRSMVVESNHKFDAARYEKVVNQLRKHKRILSRQSL